MDKAPMHNLRNAAIFGGVTLLGLAVSVPVLKQQGGNQLQIELEAAIQSEMGKIVALTKGQQYRFPTGNSTLTYNGQRGSSHRLNNCYNVGFADRLCQPNEYSPEDFHRQAHLTLHDNHQIQLLNVDVGTVTFKYLGKSL